MSANYIPTPHQPLLYTQPSDGDTKPVASINVFAQGLADAVAATATIPFNWEKSSGTTHNLERGAWQNLDQAWWGVGTGGNDFLEQSLDCARTWNDKILALGSALVCVDIAFRDGDGQGVILCGDAGKSVYTGVRTGYNSTTWTVHAAALSAQVSDGRIDNDAVSSKFVACYRVGATGQRIDTSITGTAFSAATIPAAWTGYTGIKGPTVGCNGLGKAIAWFHDDVNNLFRILRSSDMATWTETTQIPVIASAHLAAASVITRPVYSSVYGAWIIAASTTNTARQSEVWKSTDDGATWTNVSGATSNDMVIQDLAFVAGVLVAANDDGRIFFSPNLGVTWKLATTNPITNPHRPGFRGVNGQIVQWNAGDKTTFASLRYGAAGV